MNKNAKRIWNTTEGVGLFRKMLSGQALASDDRHTLEELKQADPPALRHRLKHEGHDEAMNVTDWRAVAQEHRYRVTHLIGILGAAAGYPLAIRASEFVDSIGYGAWWEPLAVWVLLPGWLVFVGLLAMKAPRLLFWGLVDPAYSSSAGDNELRQDIEQEPPTPQGTFTPPAPYGANKRDA